MGLKVYLVRLVISFLRCCFLTHLLQKIRMTFPMNGIRRRWCHLNVKVRNKRGKNSSCWEMRTVTNRNDFVF
jgi:hypothetical protein